MPCSLINNHLPPQLKKWLSVGLLRGFFFSFLILLFHLCEGLQEDERANPQNNYRMWWKVHPLSGTRHHVHLSTSKPLERKNQTPKANCVFPISLY